MAESEMVTSIENAECPRCAKSQGNVRLSVYHFGTTWVAECPYCGFGKVSGDSKDMAMSRYRGLIMDRKENK